MIVTAGLINGLLFTFLVPPWQHYDEPAQFEYAWLIANRSGFPKGDDYDQAMRREVAASMIEHNFFSDLGFRPALISQTEPVWIGISQVNDPPLYYWLVALPLRLVRTSDVTFQLYLGRLVSLLLYLVSITAAYGIIIELASPGHPLRWMMPVSMALLPGCADLMTAINNDVGATVLFSLFLWGGVRMIRQGFSFPRLLWVVSSALLCYWTKNTVFLALPLLVLVLFFSIFKVRWRWLPWIVLTAAVPVILVSIFSWGDALFWIRSANTLQKSPTRELSAQAPLGRYALQMEVAPDEPSPEILQLLPPDQVNALRGKTVTLGAWVWATQPLTTDAFTLYDGRSYFSQTVQIDTSPMFIALSATLAADASRVRVILSPAGQGSQNTITFFYDGLVLVEGARALDILPQFDDPSARRGMWGGQAFTNLLRNASGENAGLGIRLWPEENRPKLIFTYSPELALGSFLDWRGAGWYYQAATQNLLRTFWAKFGWGHVPLNLPFTSQPYSLLAMVTLAGLGGAGMAFWRRRFVLPWNVLLFLAIALAGVWGQTILRGIDSLIGTIFIPAARYAYPVIIPTVLVLNAGWLEIANYIERWTRLPSTAKFLVHFLFFLGLDIAAFLSITRFYSIR